MSYRPKTTPFPHQEELHQDTRDLVAYGLFLEQGLGKTKVVLDTAGHLFLEGKIDGLLVIAPPAVAPNWVRDEIPTHLPDAMRARCHLWESKRAKTKKHTKSAEETLSHDGLAVLVMSYEGFMTDRGTAFAKQFLTNRTCLYVLDESARIKTPGAKRTKRILASAKYAPYRRVLTGTPVANSPFDVFTQLKFLDSEIWAPFGCSNFYAFKTRFGEWVQQKLGSGRSFPKLVKYKNLDVLHKVVDSMGSRMLKEDVLDLPPKLYQKRYFEATPEQTKAIKTLKEQLYLETEDGKEVTALLAITQLLRAQQILSGFMGVDGEDGEIVELEKNPRLDTLMEIVEDCPHKMIVWARFRHDIDNICKALKAAEISHVRYDGSVGSDEREVARDSFQKVDAKVFVANPACAGEGLTLHAARTVIYFTNNFKLTDRLQSEDRAHRIGQEFPVNYIDIICSGTIDEKIVAALRDKLDIASVVTGDTLKEWL
jgi:SNF2 family DNA or RNA helicase